MKQYIINEDELKELLNAYFTLDALECGGVDNWSWYGESCCDFLKEEGVEDFDKLVDKEIMNYKEYKGE